MKDLITLGTGNSRFLKSSIPADTTLEELIELLRSGDFPIDITGMNPSGIQQAGTPLNKQTLLTDATAAQIGLTQADPTVDDALSALKSAADSGARVEVGSYVGTGVYGSDANACQITFNDAPDFIWVYAAAAVISGQNRVMTFAQTGDTTGGGSATIHYFMATALIETDYPTDNRANGLGYAASNATNKAKKSADGKTIRWYGGATATAQLNATGYTYHYIGIKAGATT